MEHTVQELDEMCGRLDRLAEQLIHTSSLGASREEQVAGEAVQLIQRIGEIIAWAYGQQHNPGMGEAFAQPFVDRRLRDRLKLLLIERGHKRQEVHNRIAAQVLQTIHILLQATPAESTLFCNLTAGWYLNDVAATRLDYQDNEDLLPLWMTVVKDIATMLNKENMMLFFDPSSPNPFPIFTEAVRYYHHPVSQVRTHVQAVSLEIFLKLRDEDVWTEPLFQLVLLESSSFFTRVCCLLREFWRMADEAFVSGAKKDLRSALYIQNDILMYINDVFACDIPRLSETMQEKLLRFAIVPVLLRSILLCRPSAALRGRQELQGDMLKPAVAVYLLHDLLATLRSSLVFETVACILLRSELPEDVLRLVAAPAPRTPTEYFAIQAAWGGTAQPGPFDKADASTDEALYAMPSVTLAEMLHFKAVPGTLARSWPLDALEEWLRSLDHAAEAAGLAASLLATCARLLAALRSSREVLDVAVAERIGSALSQALGIHHQLQWATLAIAFRVLQELALAADVPAGRARHVLIPPLRERVLHPLATELLHMLKRYGGEVQEAWVKGFQEQWALRQDTLWELPSPLRQRELLEQNTTPELSGASDGRTKCIRVLLGAWRLASALAGSSEDLDSRSMPGVGADESEESSHFKPGVPVHIGKMNRVKCVARGLRGNSQEEAVYLLPMKATLVLVRPDAQKPFWAVPVISESLRTMHLKLGSENAATLANIAAQGSADERERTLSIEVSSPRSPLLVQSGAVQARHVGGPSSVLPLSLSGNSIDRLANTLAGPALAGSAVNGTGHDRMAMSVPAVPKALQPGAKVESVSLSLVFSDERRRRVACRILSQAWQAVYLALLEGLDAFLSDVAGG